MKIKYSYYSLRFPKDIALLCFKVQENLNASYLDLPFLLPVGSAICEYNESYIIAFESKNFFVANEKMDVCLKTDKHSDVRYFGVINITSSDPEYVFWTTFFDERLTELISSFKGSSQIRRYSNPMRMSATLKSGGSDV